MLTIEKTLALAALCESNVGCIWSQYPSGDALCVCNVPLP